MFACAAGLAVSGVVFVAEENSEIHASLSNIFLYVTLSCNL